MMMGSLGATVWQAPPSPVRKLLKELFSAQPEEPLTWVHHIVWQLQAEEIALMLGSSGGQASSSAGAFEGPRTVLQPPTAMPAVVPQIHPPTVARSLPTLRHSSAEEPRADQHDEHGRRSTNVLMAAMPDFDKNRGSHSARLTHLAANTSPRPSGCFGATAYCSSHFDSHRETTVMAQPESFWGGHGLSVRGSRTRGSSYSDQLADPHRKVSRQTLGLDDLEFLTRANPRGTTNSCSTIQESPTYEGSSRISMLSETSRESVKLTGSQPIQARFSHGSRFSVASQGMQSSWISAYTGRGTMSFQLSMSRSMSAKRSSSESLASLTPRAFANISRVAATYLTASSMGPCRAIWETVWLMCVLHELWVVPFELIFMPSSESTELSTLKLVVLTCFLADVCFNFLAGYVENGHFVVDNKRIVCHYLFTWFLMDFCLIVVDIVLWVYGNKIKALKYPKLLRIARLHRMWNNMSLILKLCGHKLYWRFLVHAGRLNLALLLLAHAHAVAWAMLQPDLWRAVNSEEAYDRYLESLWWAFSAVTFGCDAPVSTQGQRLLGILIAAERETLLVGVMFCLVRCVVIHGSTDLDEDPIQDDILGFLKSRKIPAMAQQGVLASFRQVCKAQKLQKCFDALSWQELPLQIRLSVAEMLWMPKLGSLGLVKELMDYHGEFAMELAMTIHGEFLPPFTVLYENNEASHIAYYVINGVLEVFHADDAEQPTDDYIAGMWAGEKAVVNFELRRGETVTCKTLAELMVLSAMEFRRLLTRFELVGIFEDLIKVNLWLGFCGRCGLFGDHFSKDCPSLALLRKNQGFLRSLLTKKQRYLELAPRNPIGKDLRVFLQDYSLEHLLCAMSKHGIMSLMDLTREKINELAQDPDVGLTPEEEEILNNKSQVFRKKHAAGATKILANTGANDNYLVFISHYKVEAGTEATLMQNDILQLIAEDPSFPGHDLSSPVFLDTEDLCDLGQLREHVKRSHNLLLLLTNGVLKRPWVLLEIVTAVKFEVAIVPVEIQRPDLKFIYPDEDYYKQLLNGQELDESAAQLLEEEGVSMEELCSSVRQVFKRIALPFSPHKTATIRKAELQDILKRCRIKRPRASLASDPSTMLRVRSRPTSHDGALGFTHSNSGQFEFGRVMSNMSNRGGDQAKGKFQGGVKKVQALQALLKSRRLSSVAPSPQFSDAISGPSSPVCKTLSDTSASARRMKEDRARRGIHRTASDSAFASKSPRVLERGMQPILSESLVKEQSDDDDARPSDSDSAEGPQASADLA